MFYIYLYVTYVNVLLDLGIYNYHYNSKLFPKVYTQVKILRSNFVYYFFFLIRNFISFVLLSLNATLLLSYVFANIIIYLTRLRILISFSTDRYGYDAV
ncbi:hypothetical protein PUN28_002532 [Cardiocondyla obscurior]|uniref:Uncharacterized protein n=1 Tax=Cardiocondyla obscurior TaxID=286306 RepID=A0AAW2GUM7_9HYME